MITLDVNLQYLTDNYDIGAEQLKMYRGKSLQKIMEIEGETGNKKAADFNINIFSDPTELVRIFQLMNPENRYAIINNMSYKDKLKLMAMLEKGEMLMGLRFFQKDKILDMMKDLDKEKLLAVVLQKFSLEKFLTMIPEKEQNKFFDSKKITNTQILKGVQYLEPEQMARMIENVTGISQQGKDKKQMMNIMQKMKPEVLKTAVKSLEQEEKSFLIFKMAEEDPKVLKELSVEAYLFPLSQLQKGDLIESMSVLEEQDLVTMLSELPEELMTITATQLAPNKFAEILATDFSDVIGEICAAA